MVGLETCGFSWSAILSDLNFRPYRCCSNPMIKLRLKRFGKKREVSYRIVAINSEARRDGRPLEEVGFYNPRTDETRLDVPAIVRRLQQGAQPTKTVHRILEKANVFEQLKAEA
jgi:small subunit ribosomal protein S16